MPKVSKKKPVSASGGAESAQESIPPQGFLRCQLDKNLEEFKTPQNVNEQNVRVEVPYDATTKTGYAENLLHKKLEPQFVPVGIRGIINIEEALLVATRKMIHGLVKIGPKTYFPFIKFDIDVTMKVMKGPIELKSPKNYIYVRGQPVLKNKKLDTGEVYYMARGSMAAFDNFDPVEKVISYQLCHPGRVPKDSIESFRLVTAKRMGREEKDAASQEATSSSTRRETPVDADNMVPFLAKKFKKNCNVNVGDVDVGQESPTGGAGAADEIVASVENMRLVSVEPEVGSRRKSLGKPSSPRSNIRQPAQSDRTPEPTARTGERPQTSATGFMRMKMRAMKLTETGDRTMTEVIEVQSGPGTSVKLVPPEDGGGPWNVRVDYETKSKKRMHRHPSPKGNDSDSEDSGSITEPKPKYTKMPTLVVNRKASRSNILSRATPRKRRASTSGVIVSRTTSTDEILDTSENVISSSNYNSRSERGHTTDNYNDESEDSYVGLQPEQDCLWTSDDSN